MIFGKKLLFINFILFGVLFAGSVSANTCPTASPAGVGCNSGQYYCGGSCRTMSSCPTWTPIPPCATGLTCNNCATADACGVCSSCANTTTHTLCGTYPNRVCQANTTPPDNCKTYNQCTSVCSACDNGYYLAGNQCIQAVLKLGPDSVSGATAVVQSTNNTLMYLGGSGVSIGTSTIPGATALNVVGATMFSENLSMIHNKSIKVDNADSNTTLLIGNYGDDQGFGYGASTTRTASLAIEGDLKANRLCIKEDCRAEWNDIQGTSYWTASSTYIYNNNSGNVGVGDDAPTDKLSVGGNITTSNDLDVFGDAYVAGNLGVGGDPSQTWARYLDLSGSDSSVYLSRTASVTTAMIASETATPSGTSYNLGYVGKQAAIGTLSNHPLNFITNGTSKMFLTNDGKLGIGTTTPATKLQIVGGGIRLDYNQKIEAVNTINNIASLIYLDGSNYARIADFSNMNGFSVGTSSQALISGDTTKVITFTTNSAERIRVDSSGNVGIGTTTPDAKLDVNGSLAVRGSISFSGTPFVGGGNNLLMVDNSGTVTVTSTTAVGGGDYVSKTGDTMSGSLSFQAAMGSALNLNGNNISNVNKITVVTIDPLYNIGGTKYSSYAPSVVGGVKEEYIGRGSIDDCGLKNCSWRLDFSKVEKGSDLWVWRKVVDFQPERVDVVMTAYGQPALLSYEVVNNQLIFYSDRPTKFSYRLVGSRFDWRKWPTLAEDQSEEASLIVK